MEKVPPYVLDEAVWLGVNLGLGLQVSEAASEKAEPIVQRLREDEPLTVE